MSVSSTARQDSAGRPAGSDWLSWIAARGTSGARFAEYDWASTELGPVEDWPTPLRAAVMLCLSSPLAMSVRLGDELLLVHNDACLGALGPGATLGALGEPGEALWPGDASHDGADLHRVMSTGTPLLVTDCPVTSAGPSGTQERRLSCCCIPITAEDATALGVLTVYFDDDAGAPRDHRLATLVELVHEALATVPPARLPAAMMAVLAHNRLDHPRGVLYQLPRDGEKEPRELAHFGAEIPPVRSLALVRSCADDGLTHRESLPAGSARDPLYARPLVGVTGRPTGHVLVLARHHGRPWDDDLGGYLDVLTRLLGSALAGPGVREQAGTPGEVEIEWSFGVFDAMEEAVLVTDGCGEVLEVNGAFTELLGYDMADGPFRPPYPWFPSEREDPEAFARNHEIVPGSLATMSEEEELLLRSKDRRPLWVTWAASQASRPGADAVRFLHIIRDISKQRDARQRRAWAAKISADLSSAEELDTLLAVAEHGFGVLFDGGSTIQASLDDDVPILLYRGVVSTPDDLPEAVRTGLAGQRNPDALHPRPGILLVPASNNSNCRVWVQFPQPRRISADEMIVADLLAQAFALAVDRVVTVQTAGHREAGLRQALDSHRLIGQAVGILVERHRLSTMAAFERLKRTSQNRNIKLREVARQVTEQGIDPEDI